MGEPPLKRQRITADGGGLHSSSGSAQSAAVVVSVPATRGMNFPLPNAQRRGSIMGISTDVNQARLVDLCLLALCGQEDDVARATRGNEASQGPGTGIMRRPSFHNFMSKLEQHFRERLSVLFMHDRRFQNNTRVLNFAESPSLTDDELVGIPYLSNLTTLNVSCCDSLTGIAMNHIAQLPNLRQLNVSHCTKLSVGFAFMGTSKVAETLEVLNAGFCEIQDPVMSFIAQLTRVKDLDLSCNRLTDQSASLFKKFTTLKTLRLSMNPITDDTVIALCDNKELEELSVNFCKDVSSFSLRRLASALPDMKPIEMNGCDRVATDSFSRPLVLLAEDSKVQARMITMILNRYNYDVEVAVNGEEALGMFKENRDRFALILLDLFMPAMDGMTCLKEIRAYELLHKLKRTPVIIQTADTREEQRAKAIAAGCDELIRKPLDRSCIELAKDLISKNPK